MTTTRIDKSSSRREELILYAVLVAVGAIPVTGTLAEHAGFGAEATLGLVLLLLGLAGLLAALARGIHLHA